MIKIKGIDENHPLLSTSDTQLPAGLFAHSDTVRLETQYIHPVSPIEVVARLGNL